VLLQFLSASKSRDWLHLKQRHLSWIPERKRSMNSGNYSWYERATIISYVSILHKSRVISRLFRNIPLSAKIIYLWVNFLEWSFLNFYSEEKEIVCDVCLRFDCWESWIYSWLEWNSNDDFSTHLSLITINNWSL
jgi:hypothetical protein